MRWSHGQCAMAWICVTAVGLLGAACGDDDGAAVADPTVSAPVTSASADTAANDKVISVEAAAEQYVALVAAPNCAIDELNAAIEAVATTPSGAVAEDQWPAIQATVVPALVEVEVTGRDWATARTGSRVATAGRVGRRGTRAGGDRVRESLRRDRSSGGLRHVLRAL